MNWFRFMLIRCPYWLLLILLASWETSSGQSLPLPEAPLGDVPPIEPVVDRSEADEDRLQASAHLAHGRLQFRREQYPGALRNYQRAFRYSHGARTILDDVITLAFRLGRVDEAVRYCEYLDDAQRLDPFILRRLAIQLTNRQQYAAALRLYRLTVDSDAMSSAGLVTQFEMGRLCYLMDEQAKAADYFRVVWQMLHQPGELSANDQSVAKALNDEARTTYSLIAESMLAAGDPDQAAAAFERAYQDEPDSPMRDFHFARVELTNQHPEQALKRLQTYFDSGSTDAGMEPYRLLVRLLEHLPAEQQKATARERLESLWKSQQSNVFVGYFFGEYLRKENELDRAASVFQQLLETQPLLDAYQGIVRTRHQQGMSDRVIVRLAQAATVWGDLGDLGDVLATVGRQHASWEKMDQAADHLLRGQVPQQPGTDRWRVAQAMAEVASAAGRKEAADRYYEMAVELAPSPDRALWLAWGLQRLASDSPGRAVEVFRAMLEGNGQTNNDAGLVYYYLAAALALDDQFDAAYQAAQQATERLPDVDAVAVRLAWVLLLSGRLEEAYETYMRFLDQFGPGEGNRALIRDVKSSVSGIAVQLDRPREAEEWLEQILDEVPGDIGAMNDLGYLWADRGVRLHRALAMIRRAVAAEPDNRAYRDSLGWVLFRLGRFEQAVAELRKAAAGSTPDGIILEHLGDALIEVGQRQAAIQQWRRACQQLKESDPQRCRQIQTRLKELTNAEVE